jgi:hypothetical protein
VWMTRLYPLSNSITRVFTSLGVMACRLSIDRMIDSESSMDDSVNGGTVGTVHSKYADNKMPAMRKARRKGFFTVQSYSAFGYLGGMKIVCMCLFTLLLVSCESEPKVDSVPAEPTATPSTSDKIASIQERLQGQDTDVGTLEEPDYRIDQERFAPFRLSDGRIEFRGRSLADVEKMLGKPFDSKQSGDRAVVLYRVYPDDATALFLFAKGGTVERFRLDEFNGWNGSSALTWFQF